MNITEPLGRNAADAHLAADDSNNNTSQTAQTLSRLRGLVLSGELRAGSRIAELGLVEKLGVSRTPIRAALQRLELEGVLEALPTGGYRVREFEISDIEDAIELRGVMEGLAARLAAERGATPAQLTRARELLVCMDIVLSEPVFDEEQINNFYGRNDEFHQLIVEMCGSRVVRHQLQRTHSMPFASPGAFLRVNHLLPQAKVAMRISQEQHQAIIDAISRREGARAEALSQEHARRTRQNLLVALKYRATDLVEGGALIRRPVSV
ncbi:MAG: GntR family transcriptional regulator [Aquabacterium sp.]|jgi:GntR family transcriptional regulator of vanillate catabolism|nr:MAG: GntR family transcriptional regulator [Aquabacterium sp.]